MAIDREKVLQTAQKYVAKKKYDRAIAEYQKIVQQDPNDARTLLKIGDLQSRMEAYAEAIATYDRVGQFYAAQGFALKAIAVYKQIRELIKKHVPQLADRYGHIVPKLAEIYTQLGLTSDALAAYDEVATRFQRNGRDRDAIEIFRKMVTLDTTNPLPHLRLAEACCRVQAVDEAIDSFWTAAELLIRLRRNDDALKVVERILHFRQEGRYARVAAELYLARASQADGLQALAKLQLCFQQDPKSLEVLELLARAFILIQQAPKAIEVKKEIARLARDQGHVELYQQTIEYLLEVAPNDEQVRAIIRNAPSMAPDSTVSVQDDEVESVSGVTTDIDAHEIDFDEEPAYEVDAFDSAADLEVEELDLEMVEEVPRAGRSFMASAPDVVVIDEELEAAEELLDADSADARAHTRKAVVDAESFRGLRLYSKAIETLQIALEIDPRSVEIREKLRDILAEAGDQHGSIAEAVTLAAIHLDQGDYPRAEVQLYQVLDVEPDHGAARELLEQLGSHTNASALPHHGAATDSYDLLEGEDGGRQEVITAVDEFTDPDLVSEHYEDGPLPSYDLEEVSASAAMVDERRSSPMATPNRPSPAALDEVDDPFAAAVGGDAPLPSFPLGVGSELDSDLDADIDLQDLDPADVDLLDAVVPQPSAIPVLDEGASIQAIEEALDEAEFFASRGLFDDAKIIIGDQLARTPGHPLLVERLEEINQAIAESGQSGARERTELEPEESPLSNDHAFDIAASLDAFDELEEATRTSRPPSSLKGSDEVDVDQVFAKFKEGVAREVSDSDSATHYDLGVAYKEMGLLPDAIGEFEMAARDTKIECMCFAMIGMIHLEQGELDRAAEAYIQGLGAANKTIDQEMSLYYDLGNVYEMKGSASEALYYFQKIARRDPGFRDVRDRIAVLQPATGRDAFRTRSISDDSEFDAAFDELFESH